VDFFDKQSGGAERQIHTEVRGNPHGSEGKPKEINYIYQQIIPIYQKFLDVYLKNPVYCLELIL